MNHEPEYQKVDGCENGYCPVSSKIRICEKATEHRGSLRYSQEIVDSIRGVFKWLMHDVEHERHHIDREPKPRKRLKTVPKMKKEAIQPPVFDMVDSERGFPWMLTGVVPPVL